MKRTSVKKIRHHMMIRMCQLDENKKTWRSSLFLNLFQMHELLSVTLSYIYILSVNLTS